MNVGQSAAGPSNGTAPRAGSSSQGRTAQGGMGHGNQAQAQRHIMVHWPLDRNLNKAPIPWPAMLQVPNETWNSHYYLGMPYHPLNQLKQNEGRRPEHAWYVIRDSLETLLQQTKRHDITSRQIERAITKYNHVLGRKSMDNLHRLIDGMDESEKREFFTTVLPGMIRYCLRLPDIVTRPLPILKQQSNDAIVLSQQQIASLLANMFFCTFPHKQANSKLNNGLDFSQLFTSTEDTCLEKLKCILNYFHRVVTHEPNGMVTFERKSGQKWPDWSKSKKSILLPELNANGNMEDDGVGMLMVDFASKYVGSGVLTRAANQHEILFALHPELMASILFTELLDDNETLEVVGIERYNTCTGYGQTFKWESDESDTTERDETRRRKRMIVAMDAKEFGQNHDVKSVQCKTQNLQRELNKAYCGFRSGELSHPSKKCPLESVATGNWGCGYFGGDPRLKFLIQLMSASEIDRKLVYFTVKNEKLAHDMECMARSLVNKRVTVGRLYNGIVKFAKSNSSDLFGYLDNDEL